MSLNEEWGFLFLAETVIYPYLNHIILNIVLY
jgi:hypothetical protein